MCEKPQWGLEGRGGGVRRSPRGPRFTWAVAVHIEQAWRARAWEGRGVLIPFSWTPRTSGLLGRVPAGMNTVPAPAAGGGGGQVSHLPHLLSGPEAGGQSAGQSGLRPAPPSLPSLSPPLGLMGFTASPCYLTCFSHRPCLLGLNSPILPEKLREVK